MGKNTGIKPPPSGDLEGWRQVIHEGRLREFRPEDLAAAFQDLGSADKRVRDALTKQISGAIMGMLHKKRVNPNRPNGGKDIIADVHDDIFAALLRPTSADGKMLRIGFGLIVDFRLKTAIAKSIRNQVSPVPSHMRKNKSDDIEEKREALEEAVEEASLALRVTDAPADKETGEQTERRDTPKEDRAPTLALDDAGDGEFSPSKLAYNPTLLDGVNELDEAIDAKRVLNAIPEYKKRLAFYLHMEGVPAKSKRVESIAKACGASSKTVDTWIKEIQEELQQDEEAKELLKTKVGAKS
jgi:DNA-directed RNA polymerase specialized sigma24 family protein